jgi:choline dehydrogenase-like flavoprotein
VTGRTFGENDEVDVVIVGAGPSGAVAAKQLGEAGFRVVVLERGDWQDYSSIRSAEPDYELNPGADWSPRPEHRGRPWDMAIDDAHSDIGPLMWNGVGGSVMVYGGHWQRSLPSDFRTRTLDGVGDDWPVSYEELSPFYRQVEQDFGISGLDGDPAFPDTAFPMPPIRLRAWGERLGAAHNRLGWHWWPAANAIATVPFGSLKPTTELGTEMTGSLDGSKSTPDLTHWPAAIAAGVELRTRSTVITIDLDARGLARAAVYLDENGKAHRQRAKVVILAANGIMTPWLLQMSATKAHPDGLANSSGLVGRRLMLHPFSTVAGIFDENLESWGGNAGQSIYSLQFYETDRSRGFVRGAKWGLMPTGGPLATTAEFPWGAADFFGADFHATVRERLGHAAVWCIIGEDLPEETNRVVLSDTLTDDHGLRVPRVHYRTSENSRAMLRWHEQKAVESMVAAGARKTVVGPQLRNTGWHILGTAKMGADAADSVVDGDGRTHDIPNLYVFDGSIFPTSTGTNPTATIAAMALRNSMRLVAAGSKQEVPV